MGCLGNILWFLFGGLWTGLSWVAAGVLWCITIVVSPLGSSASSLRSLHFFHLARRLNLEEARFPSSVIFFG